MVNMTVTFTTENVEALLAFLGRVELKGAEVPAFNQILQQIHIAQQPKEETKDTTKKA